MERHEHHPAADIFPMMQGDAFERFKEDIRVNEQREWIVLWEDKILDGRNRYKACLELGIDPIISELEECPDPIAFVLSANLHRRHLTESQRAMIAARIANMTQGGDRKSKNQTANLQVDNPAPVTQSTASEMLSVSPRSVASAKDVLKNGSKALVQAVESGEVSVAKAASVAKSTPKPEQVKAASAKPPRKQKTTLDKLKELWGKASKKERAEFLSWKGD